MIKVKRLDCPNILKVGSTPLSSGEDEAKDAIGFYSTPANHLLSYRKTGKNGAKIQDSYTAYKDDQVRKQLKKMFHGKCAYCESKVTAIYSGDIEHFRPKGGYVLPGGLVRPGYYWLAADWDNLLFACPFCNQTNTHEILDNGTIKEVVLGKHNQFPLSSEQFRLKVHHGQIFFSNKTLYDSSYVNEESERLLLKPCTDNVENYFKYSIVGLILPTDGLSNFHKDQATNSIAAYALQRMVLVQSREQKIIEIKSQIRRVEEATINLNKYINSSDEEKTWFEGILRKELEILKKYKEPNEEYSGLATYIINQYFGSL